MQASLLVEERELVEGTFAEEALPPFEPTYERAGRSRLQARLLQTEDAPECTEPVIARRAGLLVTGERDVGVCELENEILALLAHGASMSNQEIRRRLQRTRKTDNGSAQALTKKLVGSTLHKMHRRGVMRYDVSTTNGNKYWQRAKL